MTLFLSGLVQKLSRGKKYRTWMDSPDNRCKLYLMTVNDFIHSPRERVAICC